MRGKRILAAFMCLLMLSSCGQEIKNYRVHDDLIISFTEALGKRRLVEKNIETENDGRVITKAEYTYKSENAAEDKENYLYYLFNNAEATFLGEEKVAIDSRTLDHAIMVTATNNEDTFTISIERISLAVE